MDGAPDFETLLVTVHWELHVDYRARVIKLVRSSAPFESVDAVHSSFAEVNRTMERFPLRSWGLLFDVRQIRPTHNVEIEQAFKENRQRPYAPFARYGVLVATAAGMMQVRRMLKETPDPRIDVFVDEEQAYQHVRARNSVPRRWSSPAPRRVPRSEKPQKIGARGARQEEAPLAKSTAKRHWVDSRGTTRQVGSR